MKRMIKITQVDTITGEIQYETEHFVNYDIPLHKQQFLQVCESFYNNHFTHPELSLQLRVLFPEIRSELSLPF